MQERIPLPTLEDIKSIPRTIHYEPAVTLVWLFDTLQAHKADQALIYCIDSIRTGGGYAYIPAKRQPKKVVKLISRLVAKKVAMRGLDNIRATGASVVTVKRCKTLARFDEAISPYVDELNRKYNPLFAEQQEWRKCQEAR